MASDGAHAMAPTMRHTQRGFSVMEMLVAVTVMGVSLLGLAQLMAVAMQQNSFARYNTVGIEVARGKLEQLKAAYNRQLETGVPSSQLVDGEHGPEQVMLPSYNTSYGVRTLAVKWWVQTISPSRKNVRISVWPAGAAMKESYISSQGKTITVDTALTP